jgi:hypothetical protein
MLKTQKQSCLVRYEDVIKNPTSETKKIASFLEIEFIKTKNFPQVKPNTNTLAYYLKNRNLPAYSVIKDVETIVKICSPVAAELGYNLERDKKTLFSPRRH